MLSRPSQTSKTDTIRAPESVHPLQEYLSDVQSDAGKNFPNIAEEDEEDNEGQKASSHIDTTEGDADDSDFTDLMPTKDFGELLQQFFVIDHNELFVLRTKFFLQRDINPTTLLTPSDINTHKIQVLRNQLYQLQITLFKNPKGQEYDIAR